MTLSSLYTVRREPGSLLLALREAVVFKINADSACKTDLYLYISGVGPCVNLIRSYWITL